MFYYALCLSYHSTQKLFCLHVFRQAGPSQRVDCLALRWETALSVFPRDIATRYRIGSRTKISQFSRRRRNDPNYLGETDCCVFREELYARVCIWLVRAWVRILFAAIVADIPPGSFKLMTFRLIFRMLGFNVFNLLFV